MKSESSPITFESSDELMTFVIEKSRLAATTAAIDLIPALLRHVAASVVSSSVSSDSQESDKVATEIIAKIADGISKFADDFEKNPPSISTALAGEADS